MKNSGGTRNGEMDVLKSKIENNAFLIFPHLEPS